MNRGIYSAGTGMLAAQRWMDVQSNNLANATTIGFKQDGLVFGDYFERQLFAQGRPQAALGSLGSGATVRSAYTDFSAGALKSTGNPLDLAIESPRGMFAVETPEGVRYTRNGAFTAGEDGLLQTKDGLPVLDDRGRPIDVARGNVVVEPDGSVSVDGREVARIALFDGNFAKAGGSLYDSADARPAPGIRILQGSLEESNVNTVAAMIEMIKIGRTFELAQKSIQSQDELTQRLIQSLQDR
jgi:flagellar basal-body rod protein FlgF